MGGWGRVQGGGMCFTSSAYVISANTVQIIWQGLEGTRGRKPKDIALQCWRGRGSAITQHMPDILGHSGWSTGLHQESKAVW